MYNINFPILLTNILSQYMISSGDSQDMIYEQVYKFSKSIEDIHSYKTMFNLKILNLSEEKLRIITMNIQSLFKDNKDEISINTIRENEKTHLHIKVDVSLIISTALMYNLKDILDCNSYTLKLEYNKLMGCYEKIKDNRDCSIFRNIINPLFSLQMNKFLLLLSYVYIYRNDTDIAMDDYIESISYFTRDLQ